MSNTGWWTDNLGEKWFVIERTDGVIVADSEKGSFTAASAKTFRVWQSWGWKRIESDAVRT